MHPIQYSIYEYVTYHKFQNIYNSLIHHVRFALASSWPHNSLS